MRTDPDADLRALFGDLRADDHAAVPPFDGRCVGTQTRTQTRARLWPGAAWAAGGLAIVTTAGLWLVLQPPAFEAATAALPAWQAPTDTLLVDAGDPLHRLSWATLPTHELGRPTFSHYREVR
ncbi:MAG: hypothetical protein ACREVG_08805 [Burkholderiales bacterium]